MRALVERRGGELVRATFRNVPSHVIARGVPVQTSRGEVRADLSFSGAIYASVRAADLGLAVDPEHYTELIALGREIKWALNDSAEAQFDDDPRLSGVYGTILFDDLGQHASGPRGRNVTVFADGEVDRSRAARAPARASRCSLMTAASPRGKRSSTDPLSTRCSRRAGTPVRHGLTAPRP